MKDKDIEEGHRVLSAVLREDLKSFTRKVFATLNPGTDFMDSWYLDAMAYEMTRLSNGENKRLLITLPPRHMKSTMASVAWVAWMLGRHPDMRIIGVSYGEELAIRLSNETRRVMTADWYRKAFPNTIISDKKNTESYFETTAGGFRMATTIGGAMTGMGGDAIVIDDPHKAEDAHSITKLKAAVDWLRESALTRLNNPKKGIVVVIQQRFHEEDMAGTLIETGGWHHLNLPAIAQANEDIPVSDEYIYARKKGEALHPARLSLDDLREIETAMGAPAFAAQYLQMPGPIGGDIVKLEWFKRYYGEMTPRVGDHIFQSWDFAYTVTSRSDYTVCLTWLVRNHRFYLLHVFRDKVKGVALKNLIRRSASHWNAELVLMEGTGSASLLAAELQGEDPHKYWIHEPSDSKEERLHMYARYIEAGRFYLPYDASWLPAFERELQSFPKGKYDDQVDALSQTMLVTTCRLMNGDLAAPIDMFPDPQSDDPETDPYANIG